MGYTQVNEVQLYFNKFIGQVYNCAYWPFSSDIFGSIVYNWKILKHRCSFKMQELFIVYTQCLTVDLNKSLKNNSVKEAYSRPFILDWLIFIPKLFIELRGKRRKLKKNTNWGWTVCHLYFSFCLKRTSKHPSYYCQANDQRIFSRTKENLINHVRESNKFHHVCYRCCMLNFN